MEGRERAGGEGRENAREGGNEGGREEEIIVMDKVKKGS